MNLVTVSSSKIARSAKCAKKVLFVQKKGKTWDFSCLKLSIINGFCLGFQTGMQNLNEVTEHKSYGLIQ